MHFEIMCNLLIDVCGIVTRIDILWLSHLSIMGLQFVHISVKKFESCQDQISVCENSANRPQQVAIYHDDDDGFSCCHEFRQELLRPVYTKCQ